MQLAEVGLGVKGEPVAVGASLTGFSALVLVVNILARNFKTSVALTLDEAPLLLLLLVLLVLLLLLPPLPLLLLLMLLSLVP